MTFSKTSLRVEKRKLRELMRSAGLDYRQIATEFARVYRLRPRSAWREAYGWSLQEIAEKINTYLGDAGLDPRGLCSMTSAHLSEYESWPGYGDKPTGRRPNPHLLTILADIYGCHVSDLMDLADRQNHPEKDLLIIDTYSRHDDRPGINTNPHIRPASQTADCGVMTSEESGGSPYVVLGLPNGSQRVVIDITGAGADGQNAIPQSPARLTLVGGEKGSGGLWQAIPITES